MISSQQLILAESFHSKLLCNTEECLSYILVLLNLLTIFYLVYSSYKKVTKITRIFGYFWSCFIMCANVTVLFIHTCIFTIMCTVFTGMAIIAVLSMIYESKQEERESSSNNNYGTNKTAQGCYVIYRTDDNKFAFALHAKNKKLLLSSVYKYTTLEETKEAIVRCRDYGSMADLENSTGEWVLDVRHPKFRLYKKEDSYCVDLAISEEMVLLKSESIEVYGDAFWYANDAMKCVGSDVLYFANGKKNILEGSEFLDVNQPRKPETMQD